MRSRYLKLIDRYRHRYISDHRSKKPHNCLYNIEHTTSTYREDSLEKYVELAPRKSNTLIVINSDQAIRLCGYGSDDVKSWNGDICDSEEISKTCALFRPIKKDSDLNADFEDILKDDRATMEHYPDVANLQWVLESRFNYGDMIIPWYERWLMKIKHFLGIS